MSSFRYVVLATAAALLTACGSPAAPTPTTAPAPTQAAAKPAQPAAPSPAAAVPQPTAAAQPKPTTAPAQAQPTAAAKPAVAVPAIPADWQALRSPAAGDCQVSLPGGWQLMPQSAMGMLGDQASAVVGPSSQAEAEALKTGLRQTPGATLHVDTPTRWLAEIPNPAGGTAYYVFWTAGSSGCFFTLQLTPAGAQTLGPVARQIADAAGAGR